DEKNAAVQARKDEEKAKKDALAQKQTAVEQREKARVAQAKAETEEKNAKLAQAAAEKAKEQEEYEAYIARIGLAAAKIDENAFGSARELLEGCKPELRNWEWGRLSYLCGLSDEFVDGKAPLESVAFSGDGSRFVTGGWNHSIDIWNTESHEL